MVKTHHVLRANLALQMLTGTSGTRADGNAIVTHVLLNAISPSHAHISSLITSTSTMPKRLLISLSDVTPARKRMKHMEAVWIDGKCFQYDPKTNKRRQKTSFLDLPLEMREEIYHHALKDVASTISHPYGVLPTHDRFRSYRTLRLLGRQISQEVASIWEKSYEKQIVFYLDNPPELYDLWQQIKHHPRMHEARFFLKADDFDSKLGKIKTPISEDSEAFLDVQRGSNYIWRVIGGVFDHDDGAWTVGLHRPQDSGFEMKDGKHDSCNGISCHKYKTVIFPPMSPSLRMFTVSWRKLVPYPELGFKRVQKVVRTVVEGKLCDVQWD